eukprot:COSAG01_NODE_385_length_17743_cov_20.528622_2_plen_125_part_00
MRIWTRPVRWGALGLQGGFLGFFLAFKVYQWYVGAQAQIPAKQRYIPPPPPPAEPDPTAPAYPPPADASLCPLCRKEVTNTTMLPSGWVFCYPCIFNHVQAHGACPVTAQPVNPEQLRKIYIDS